MRGSSARAMAGALAVLLLLGGCGARNPFTSPGQTLPPGQTLAPGQTQQPGQPGAAPPGWLAPGMRLTWYVAAASVANSRFSIVEDPNGNLVDPQTGKKYRRTDAPGGEGQPKQEGHRCDAELPAVGRRPGGDRHRSRHRAAAR